MSDFVFSLISLSLATVIAVFVGYINWHGNIKRDSVAWIGKKICRPLFGDEAQADGIFMYMTGLLLATIGLLVMFGLP
ncbi:MAG: hypothetical protein A3C93_01955 [Candidatus Lloydbacteria bacterium RIFCSPHIGHO2_02_FULL_54_17]|uniref:Uncharacterized protein n=1 Tax=Candidatus Lloydbacteria bacterium RIFCSPHIGHO2_02_FULL_54_17 TaxID=1798664 RepID=A0A1G2DAA6_9BACT|nr:MAG: hypothetical protein A3C93_01955 [Candidatus Lloydbacteria bacterium RIFCSPHIGHO2_02_FULL_54_17]OGZ14749.1 MAG: hypothetical protein A2948_04610 [Candidatus Lloydbacteria bacterium RIFCSPLOWO2_01_FULL_54_18]OGZ17026.1 MAG: hypothetical protein A3H76_06865 [Candidatus Lloydbacteria bacterium RIFCSPLOWO2_02_FULL_54_12]